MPEETLLQGLNTSSVCKEPVAVLQSAICDNGLLRFPLSSSKSRGSQVLGCCCVILVQGPHTLPTPLQFKPIQVALLCCKVNKIILKTKKKKLKFVA
jgi:hypothetical protein